MKNAIKFTSLKNFLEKSTEFSELRSQMSKNNFSRASEISENLCQSLKINHFGDNIYRYVLQIQAFCLAKEKRYKDAEIILRNIAEFTKANPKASPNEILDSMLNIFLHAFHYDFENVFL